MPNAGNDHLPCVPQQANCVYQRYWCSYQTLSGSSQTYTRGVTETCYQCQSESGPYTTSAGFCINQDNFNSTFSGLAQYTSFCNAINENTNCGNCDSALGSILGGAAIISMLSAGSDVAVTDAITAGLYAAGYADIQDIEAKTLAAAEAILNVGAFGSYLNDVSFTLYTIKTNNTSYTLTNQMINLPVNCTNSVINIPNNTPTSIRPTTLTQTQILNQPNALITFTGGTNSFTGKPNTLKLFWITRSALQCSNANLFACLYYTDLLNNPTSTEESLLNAFSSKVGFSNYGYDYFQNDFYYNYASINQMLFATTTNQSVNYQLTCVRICSQIFFLWELVYYFAQQKGLVTDIYFSVNFYSCISKYLNGTQIILTEQINTFFPDLLPNSLDSTISYWVGQINSAINITNIFLLKHSFSLLDFNLDQLEQNNVAVLAENGISYYDYLVTLNKIFQYVSNTYLQQTLQDQIFSETLIGIPPNSTQIPSGCGNYLSPNIVIGPSPFCNAISESVATATFQQKQEIVTVTGSATASATGNLPNQTSTFAQIASSQLAVQEVLNNKKIFPTGTPSEIVVNVNSVIKTNKNQ